MGLRDWFRRRVMNLPNADTVRFYDFESQSVINIPRSELRPGLIQAQIEGIDGTVWVSPDRSTTVPVRHEPFDEEIRYAIRKIHDTFAEHRDLSLTEWEDGFRCDMEPAGEIALWLHAADVYTKFTESETSPERRSDVYRCIVACLTTVTKDNVWDVLELQIIDRLEAEQIVGCFYGKNSWVLTR